MVVLDSVYVYGHENILCAHNTTIEITKDEVAEFDRNREIILSSNGSEGAFWILSRETRIPALHQGVMAMLWVMRCPRGPVG